MAEGTTKSEFRKVIREAVMESMAPWKSAKEAAVYLGVSKSWILQKRREGVLPAHVSGSNVRFKTDDLDALMTPEARE